MKLEAKGFVRWRPPEEPEMQARRELWMPGELKETIKTWDGGAMSDKRAKDNRLDTISYLTSFIAGDALDVGVRDDRCYLKAMTPAKGLPWLVWEMRILIKPTHTRIFGVFLGPQDFLAHSIRAKNSMSTAQQSQMDTQTRSFAATTVGQNLISSKNRPFASTLGGAEYEYEDYVDDDA